MPGSMRWRPDSRTAAGPYLQAYYHYSERKWITLHGLENVNALYKEYHALGGNGAVTKLVEDLRELEVRDG